ncbi:MAG: hypothetical protein PHD48_09650 [Alphaproteobacteria bacterium]|nr:hypothetical protein [Alphaproteobacteria bacterium]
MSIEKLSIIRDYEALNASREIYPDYQCNCTKVWREEDKLVVFKATSAGIDKIYEGDNSPDAEKTITILAKLAGVEMTDRAIIAGGHTVVNLKDRFCVGQEVVRSANLALGFVARLQEEFGKQAEFLMPLNDFYMEKDAGTDEGSANAFRKEAVSPYVIPPQINDLLIQYSSRLGRELALHYCSEKNMADRFKRHIKSKKKDGSGQFVQNGNNWEMVVGSDRIVVLTNDKPNCAAGNAATLRAIRYDIDNNKVRDNFTSHVGIYPLCSLDNVLDGHKLATAFYRLELPTFFVFCGKSCFDHEAQRSKVNVDGRVVNLKSPAP